MNLFDITGNSFGLMSMCSSEFSLIFRYFGQIKALTNFMYCYFCNMFLSIVSSVTLKNIIQKNFPEEYAERKQEHDGLIKAGVDLLPLFVMDVVIPCQRFPLNIFEPRYRLMVSW